MTTKMALGKVTKVGQNQELEATPARRFLDQSHKGRPMPPVMMLSSRRMRGF